MMSPSWNEKCIHATFTKVKTEIKELRLEKALEHTMTIRL